MKLKWLIITLLAGISQASFSQTAKIDSAFALLEGCWSWDYYGGGIAGLPHTPAWKDVRLEFARDAQDSINGTISFRTYADTMAVDSGRTGVWTNPAYPSWLVMDDLLVRALPGFPMPPFPPIYFIEAHGAIEFTHLDFADDFYYGFVKDSCSVPVPPVPDEAIDSIIGLLAGCWRYDYYEGGLAGFPPTPSGVDLKFRFSRDAQDSLNQTMSYWKFENSIATDSGRVQVKVDAHNFYGSQFIPDIIAGSDSIAYWFQKDTLLFTHFYPDDFTYGYARDICPEPSSPLEDVDSIIEMLKGCWLLDHYFGGFPGIPPTPAWINVSIDFSQTPQDSLDHTVTGKSYLHDTLNYSGTCNIMIDTNANGLHFLSCPLFDNIGIVGGPPLYFNFEGDTLLFPQESFVDGYVYGFLKDCEEDTVDNINLPDNLFMKIYPNPASDIIIIEMDKEEVVNMSMYDLVGKRLLEKQPGSIKITVDISDIPDGIYFIRIETEKGMAVRKMVVRR